MDSNTNPAFFMRARLGSGPEPGRISPLRMLATITLIHFCLAAVFLHSLGTNPLYLLVGVFKTFPEALNLAKQVAPVWVVVAVAAGVLAVPGARRRIRGKLTEILLIAAYCSMFTFSFGFMKTHLPLLFPFWADPMLTRLDAVMTPRASVTWMDAIPFPVILNAYFNIWVVGATLFPVFMAVFDPNDRRRRVFTALWATCWIGLGNVLAAGFMSVGPIFLDTLPGGDPARYPDVFELLMRPEAAALLEVKDRLWNAYTSGQVLVGSGISAFPSVHVGMATVIALYLGAVLTGWARARASRLSGRVIKAVAVFLPVAIVVFYQLVTVYIGMHYAIDGYASILLMILAWRWLSHSALAR
ncbi:MAG: hypothetical protein CSA74_02945 [Rhodobacterales bacterium]|nr:MAG: hypothetical protein CSA74_02945 [Rhodobacterales bacterium]